MILEAPGGLIEVVATCKNVKVTNVTIYNTPSFVDKLDAIIEVEGIGTITVDTAYGGDTFVILDAATLGFQVTPDEARDIVEVGTKISNAANEKLSFCHPQNPDWKHISFCQLAAPLRKVDGELIGLNTVVIQPGKLDRSPTGTGCSARMALLYEKGLLKKGDVFIGESIIGSRFHCRIGSTSKLGSKTVIRPVFSGRAWITGTHQHTLDPSDPWPQGYRVSDTWPIMG